MIASKPNRTFLAALVLLSSIAGTSHADRIISPGDSLGGTRLDQRELNVTNSPEEAISKGHILVVGQGLPMAGGSPARQRLTAIRAAEITAYRRLAEIINGVHVTGQTTVRDCTLENETVKTVVSGLIKGARKVYEEWDPVQELAVVYLQLSMHGPGSLTEAMYNTYINADAGRAKLQTVSFNVGAGTNEVPAATVPAATPMTVAVTTIAKSPEPNDGLIIDARDLAFQPALINRIFSAKGDALYDPSKISQKILVSQGAGEYTNTLEKARAALAARGSKFPLEIKAIGLKSMADLNVHDDDVLRIIQADQKNSFLAAAKVAFVLK